MSIGRAESRGLALMAAGLAAAAVAKRTMRRRSAYDFSGKSIVITGGSRVLGLVLARQLAGEGARLTLIARDQSELRRAADDLRDGQPSADVLIVPADVRERDDVERVV